MRCLPVYNLQNSYSNNNITLSTNNSTSAYKSKTNLFKQSNIDQISFSSKFGPNIELRMISDCKKKQKILDYIMQVNGPDGPLVENLCKYFSEKNPEVPVKYFKDSISNMYQKQAECIAEMSISDKNTIVVGAFDKKSEKIAGIASIIPIGYVNGDTIIYEGCNFAVLKEYLYSFIGKDLIEFEIQQIKDKKAIVLTESINPAVKKFLIRRGITEESKNSKTLLEALEARGCYYSKTWLHLKEFNIDTFNIENIQVNNKIFDTCNAAWPELSQYY